MATSSLVGALRVTLGLETAAFEKGADQAARRSSKLQKEVSGNLDKIKDSMNPLKAAAAGLVGALSIGLFAGLAREALDYASSLGEVAQQLGVTSKTLQEYRFMATQVGIDQETMDKGLQKLTLNLGKADAGSKAQAKAFQELGISTRDAAGHLKTTDNILPEIIAKLSAILDPAKRAAIEVALFGKAGQQLDTLLAGGIDQVNKLKEAAAALGVVLSEDQIANADRTADKLAELKTVLEANIAGAVANNARSIYDFVNSLERLVAKVPAVINEIGKLRAYLNLASGTINSWTPLAWVSSARRQSAAKEIEGARLDLWQRNGRPGQDQISPQSLDALADLRRDIARGGSGSTSGDGAGGGARGGGKGRTRGGGGHSRPTRSAEDSLQQTLDSLLPDDAERRRLAEQSKLLRAALARGGLDQATFDRAMGAVSERQDKISRLTGPDWASKDGMPDLKIPETKVQVDDLSHLLDGVKKQNFLLSESFVDMAQTAMSSFQNLANSIRGGGLLNILSSVLDAFMSLGSAGVLGKSIQTGLRGGIAGARAAGGPVDGGRTYLVGERGPELFTAPGSGTIVPNHALGGAPVYFDLSGAVMTTDLVAQMEYVANATSGRMITANNASLMKRSRQQLGRR